MLTGLLTGYNLREYNVNVQRFFLFAIPLFSGMALFSLLYNLYLLRLDFQEDFIGRLAGVFQLASGVVAIPTGLLSDRFGRKPFLILTALLLTIAHLGMLLTVDATTLLIISAVGGMAGGFVFVNFIPFLAENAAPERRGQAIAIWMSIGVLTRMFVNLIGGALPGLVARFTGTSTDLADPFRYTLFLGAALTLIALVPLIGIRAPGVKRDAEDDRRQAAEGVPWRHLLTFGGVSAMRGMAMGLSFPFFNVFFAQTLDAKTATIGLIFSVSQVVGFPSTVAAPAIVRRIGPRLTIIPIRILGAVALAVLGLMGNLPLAALIFLAAMVTESITTPSEMTFATNTLPRAYWARMQSLRVTGFQVAAGIASAVAGVLILRYGYWAAFMVAGTARVGSAVIFALAFGLRRRS